MQLTALLAIIFMPVSAYLGLTACVACSTKSRGATGKAGASQHVHIIAHGYRRQEAAEGLEQD